MLGDKLLSPPHSMKDFNVTGSGGLAELQAWCTKDKTGDLFDRCADVITTLWSFKTHFVSRLMLCIEIESE